jgi:hypothetical protein
MKKNYFIKTNVLLSILAAFFLVIQLMAQQEAYTGAKNPAANKVMAVKPDIDYSHLYLPPTGREGGETIGTAIPILSLPYSDFGNTCDNINDYDESCPYTGSTAPDVVYSYSPAANQSINIDLLGSSYDTKVFVYENSYTPGSPYACNDDYYANWVSAIWGMPVTAGNTYYIVIDGYGGACGDYVLSIPLAISCTDCIPCSIPEGEGDIPNNGTDNFNGGCNSIPSVFSPILLNQVICGRTNTYYDASGATSRDTDWYEITLTEAGTLYWSAIADFRLNLFILNDNCNSIVLYASGQATNCSPASISAALPAGTYYLWAGYYDYSGLPIGRNYNAVATFNAPPPDDWCNINPPPVPVSNWALFIGIGLILVFAVVRLKRIS